MTAAILATQEAGKGAANCRSPFGETRTGHYNPHSPRSIDVIARPASRLYPRGRLAVLLHIRLLVLALVTLALAASSIGGFQSPVVSAGTVLALAAATLILWLRARRDDEGAPLEAFLHLCVDVFLVVTWLALSGAAANPFVFLLIVPVALAAAMLPPRLAAATVLLSVAGYTSLLFLPTGTEAMLTLHANHDEALAVSATGVNGGQEFARHLWGMWIAFIVTTIFVGAFVYWIASNLHRRQAAFNALEKRQLLEQKVVALATLSASTAHQLATPLSVIRVAVGDLIEDKRAAALREPLARISEQALACTRILRQLGRVAQNIDEHSGKATTLAALLLDIATELRALRPEAAPVIEIEECERERAVHVDGSLRLAFMALLDNAAKASPHDVRVETARRGDALEIRVLDRGPGMQATAGARNAKGMGIGILLARASLQSVNGSLEYHARPGGGTIAHVTIPLAELSENA